MERQVDAISGVQYEYFQSMDDLLAIFTDVLPTNAVLIKIPLNFLNLDNRTFLRKILFHLDSMSKFAIIKLVIDDYDRFDSEIQVTSQNLKDLLAGITNIMGIEAIEVGKTFNSVKSAGKGVCTVNDPDAQDKLDRLMTIYKKVQSYLQEWPAILAIEGNNFKIASMFYHDCFTDKPKIDIINFVQLSSTKLQILDVKAFDGIDFQQFKTDFGKPILVTYAGDLNPDDDNQMFPNIIHDPMTIG